MLKTGKHPVLEEESVCFSKEEMLNIVTFKKRAYMGEKYFLKKPCFGKSSGFSF